jgi:putative transposase
MNYMAVARKYLVDKETAGFYHCTNRCVRRTFLCGIDEVTGTDYSHRKAWLEDRMKALCDIFAVDIYAHAIMDNHYHIVLYVDPKAPQSWSNEEVAERWMQVYPSRLDKSENARQRELTKLALMDNPEKLAICRERLGDLSWYMRRLNEPLAKLSNQQDDCTGKFWEDRYKSQALLDEAAVISCMAYVDLNPVRAKITQKLEESHFTSIQSRLKQTEHPKKDNCLQTKLSAVAGTTRQNPLPMNLIEYIQLVEWTGQSIIYPDKAAIPQHITPILQRLNLQQDNWLKQIENLGNNYYHVIGTVDLIRAKARQMGRRCLQGIAVARQLYIVNT